MSKILYNNGSNNARATPIPVDMFSSKTATACLPKYLRVFLNSRGLW